MDVNIHIEVVDQCENHDCQYNCTTVNNMRKCLCPVGYVIGPDQRTCEDENECATQEANCCDPGKFKEISTTTVFPHINKL